MENRATHRPAPEYRPPDSPLYGWHFLLPSGMVARDQVLAVPDLTLHKNPPIELYKRGYHAAKAPLDALMYAGSTIVEFCALWGHIESVPWAMAAEYRQTIWVENIAYQLERFTEDCIEYVAGLGPAQSRYADGMRRYVAAQKAATVSRPTITPAMTAHAVARAVIDVFGIGFRAENHLDPTWLHLNGVLSNLLLPRTFEAAQFAPRNP